MSLTQKPWFFRATPSLIPYNNQPNAWNDIKLTMWWFHDVFMPDIRKRTSKQVVLLANHFGSHDIYDPALQDSRVKWILIVLLCTSPWTMVLLLHLKLGIRASFFISWSEILKIMISYGSLELLWQLVYGA